MAFSCLLFSNYWLCSTEWLDSRMGTWSAARLLFTSNFLVLWLLYFWILRHANDVWTKFQGDRTENIGVVDAEYIAHLALPTLGTSDGKKASTPVNSFRTLIVLTAWVFIMNNSLIYIFLIWEHYEHYDYESCSAYSLIWNWVSSLVYHLPKNHPKVRSST